MHLCLPFRHNAVGEDVWTYHDLPKSVSVHTIGTVDRIAQKGLPGFLRLWLMNRSLRGGLPSVLARIEPALLYTRSPALLSSLLKAGVPVVLEVHGLPRFGQGAFVRRAARCHLVVALTTVLRDALVAGGVDADRIIVAGDAVDLQEFSSLPAAATTRVSYGIVPAQRLVVYAGQLETMGLSKGVPELLSAMEIVLRTHPTARAIIAGGPADAVERLKQGLSPSLREAVRFLGHIPRTEVLPLLAAADVLVYPAPRSSHPFFMRDTSPMKIFEYMAAGRPIVAAELPPLRDVLDPSVAYLCAPGDPASLAAGLRSVFDDPAAAAERAARAGELVKGHTWERRMQRILRSAAA